MSNTPYQYPNHPTSIPVSNQDEPLIVQNHPLLSTRCCLGMTSDLSKKASPPVGKTSDEGSVEASNTPGDGETASTFVPDTESRNSKSEKGKLETINVSMVPKDTEPYSRPTMKSGR